MSNAKNLAILAAVGLGAYFLMTRMGASGGSAIAARPGTVGYMPPNSQQLQTRAQTDNLNNSTLYGVGRFINGLFSGGSAPTGGGAGNQYTGTREIANDDLPGDAGYGWRYYSDGTSIGPDGTYYQNGQAIWSAPDALAINPPGGYEPSTAVLYSDDMYGSWN